MTECDATDLELLALCRTFATLDDHAFRACLALRVSPDHAPVIRQRLVRLAEVGLLVPREHVEEILSAAPGQRSEPVSVVGVPTRNRPAVLARWVAEVTRTARAVEREAEYVVCDGSDDPSVQAECRRSVDEARGTFPGGMTYFGPPERERYVERLIRAGADPAAVRFALVPDPRLGFAAGANRNLLCLLAAGRVLLQTDDDVLGRVSGIPGATGGLALTSSRDPTEFWFPADLGPPPDAPADVAGVHEGLLGRGVGDCVASVLGGGVDLDGADAAFFLRLRQFGGRVRVTTPGIFGNSGMGASPYPLYMQGPSRHRLHESNAMYTAMHAGAHTIRGVTRPTITGGSVCTGLSLGLDLRSPLPPVPPALRNEDGIFAAVMQECCPAAFQGHLPLAVWHLPGEDRTRPPDAFLRTADGPRGDQLLLHFVRTCASKRPSPDERRNLRVLGEGLMGIGDQSPEAFRSTVLSTAWELAAATTARLSELLDEYGGEPEWWAADVRALCDRYAKAATDGWPGTLSELTREGISPQTALELFREFVRSYGHLLLHWYDMADAARTIHR